MKWGVLLLALGLLPPPAPRGPGTGAMPVAATPVAFSGRVGSQDPLPRIRMEVDTAVVTVGDPIHLRVTVEHAPQARILWPDSLDLSPFEVLDARGSGPDAQGQISRSSLLLTLAAYRLGDLEIPAFQVTVSRPPGDTTRLETPPYGVQVESVGLDESGDIRDVKGPVSLPLSPERMALWGLVVLLLGATAMVLYRRLKRGAEKPILPEAETPTRPPHEVALEALERLEASPLLERGEVKEYHIRVSEILRTYVEERFQVPALEMTTRHILSGLGRSGVEPRLQEELRHFLERCDLVKFAKDRPDPRRARSVLAVGRRFVEETIREPVGVLETAAPAQEDAP